MNPIRTLIVVALLSPFYLNAQSVSYKTLKDTFDESEKVHSFKVSGFLCRVVMKMAGEWEFRDAIRDLKSVRIINIPKPEFASRQLTVSGFKKILKGDSFEELASMIDHGDRIYIYLQQKRNTSNRYFVLIDADDEVTGVELNGYIDINLLLDRNKEIATLNK